MSKPESEIRFPFDEAFIEPVAETTIRQKISAFTQKFPLEKLYLSQEVLYGWEHSFRHIVTLLTYINYFGPSADIFARQNDLKFNLRAQEITGFFHDSQRANDREDCDHAQRAARLLARLNMQRLLFENGDTMDTAIQVCARHNEHPNHHQQDFNLGFFRRLDGQAWVRYEGRERETEMPDFRGVTTEFLDTIFPGVAPKNIAQTHLVMARFMQRRIDTKMREQGVLETDFEKVLDICLESGVAAGFLS